MLPPWSKEKARQWYESQPWPVGCNFIPSNAVNQLEMWQAETFDPAAIERELGWAAELGFNTVRVYLHDLVWNEDPEGYLRRIRALLDICGGFGIRSILVFFDDCWNSSPQAGTQPAPVPHTHNSHWMESPGLEGVTSFPKNVRLQERLKTYVQGVMDALRKDPRILMWDLYNEPESRFESILPFLKEKGVGAINWGLVSGKTQTVYPWDSWEKEYREEPDPWFHDIPREDGSAYNGNEVDLIKNACRG